jgi:hypothetical protein
MNSSFRNSESQSAPKNSGIPKKKSHSITEKAESLNKHLKTMEKEWNPVETKKAVNFRD